MSNVEANCSDIIQDKNSSQSEIKSFINSILAQREIVYWCAYFFVTNLAITFYNKHMLSSLNISPLINTFIHMTFTFIGCLIVQKGGFPSLTSKEFFQMVVYAFIFALNILWSQFAMKLTTLNLNQICAAMTPLFHATFSDLIANKKHTLHSLIPLIPVCVVIAITANSELNFNLVAVMISISSIIVSALKGVLSMKILQHDLKSKLQEYSFLLIVCPLAAVWIFIIELLFYFLYSNESNFSNDIYSNIFDIRTLSLLSIGGFMAFAVNVASIGAVKRTSATAMGVMCNTKQALTIFGSMVFGESNWVMRKLFGVCVAICGALYSYRKEMERRPIVLIGTVQKQSPIQ
eukprot:263945_1